MERCPKCRNNTLTRVKTFSLEGEMEYHQCLSCTYVENIDKKRKKYGY